MSVTVEAQEIRKLRLDAIQEENFRINSGVKLEDDKNWQSARKTVLVRDNYTCYYCGFQYMQYMEVHHKKGNWQDDSSDNLITLCPLCHSCMHIGLAGIQERGSLLVLKNSCDQAKLNRLILDTVIQYGNRAPKAIEEIYNNLHVVQDLECNGLVVLANKIGKEKATRKSNPRPIADNFIFFPDIMKFNIVRHIMAKFKD